MSENDFARRVLRRAALENVHEPTLLIAGQPYPVTKLRELQAAEQLGQWGVNCEQYIRRFIEIADRPNDVMILFNWKGNEVPIEECWPPNAEHLPPISFVSVPGRTRLEIDGIMSSEESDALAEVNVPLL